MREVRFNKERAEDFIRAFRDNQPIHPPATGEWTTDDALTLAGVCLTAVHCGETLAHDDSRRRRNQPIHVEHQELEQAQRGEDLVAAVVFIGRLATLMRANRFDQYCEPKVWGEVEFSGDLHYNFKPIKGVSSDLPLDDASPPLR